MHPEWEGGYFTFNSPVTIRLKDGTEHKKLWVDARGDPSKRLGPDEVMKKYLDCMDFAGSFSKGLAERAAEMTLALDKVQDVSELMSIFTFPRGA